MHSQLVGDFFGGLFLCFFFWGSFVFAFPGRPVGLQDAIVESLMKAYFVEEKNVGDRTVLSDVITRAMPGDPALVAEAEAFIGSDAGEAETMTEVQIHTLPPPIPLGVWVGQKKTKKHNVVSICND